MPDEPGEFLPIGAQLLANAIRKTVFAVNEDQKNHTLSGVVIVPGPSSVRVFGVSGHRLALMDMSIGLALPPMIVPRAAAVQVAAMLEEGAEDAEVACDGKRMFVRFDNFMVVANLNKAGAPNVEPFMETSATAVEVPRDELLGALRRADLMSTKDLDGALLTLSEGNLTIESTNPNVGEARTRISVDAPGKWHFLASIRYLTDALSAMDVSTVDMFVTSDVNPVLIRPHGGAWQSMVIAPRSGK
jgi:DNA polymerase-3 subunit beta